MSEKSLLLHGYTFDPPKSPLKSARILGVALLPQNFEQDRGTLRKFSPLFKGGWGGSDTSQTSSYTPLAQVLNLCCVNYFAKHL
jgi:hypothetical protein